MVKTKKTLVFTTCGDDGTNERAGWRRCVEAATAWLWG